MTDEYSLLMTVMCVSRAPAAHGLLDLPVELRDDAVVVCVDAGAQECVSLLQQTRHVLVHAHTHTLVCALAHTHTRRLLLLLQPINNTDSCQ